MSQRVLLALIALLAAALLGVAFFWQPQPGRGGMPDAKPSGGDFTLQSAGGPISLHDFRGKVVVLYFGYTYCPDVCPTALAAVGQALGSLSAAELARVQTLFVSVDPERDTVTQLKDYTTFFHPSILGLTGSPEEVAAVARLYGVFYAKQTAAAGAGGYVVDHTSLTYLVAPDGRLAATLPHGAAPAAVAAEIRKLLSSSLPMKGTAS
jgi:protein SCO1/2